MTKPKTENYELAARRVKSGTWKVDPVKGVVYNTRGVAFKCKNTGGYIQIKFYEPGEWPHKTRTALAHRVIFEAVHGPLSEDLTVNHINGDHTDNRISNLESMTQVENVQHAVRTGLYHANCAYCRDHGGDHKASKKTKNSTPKGGQR